jgi:hypothetical protein
LLWELFYDCPIRERFRIMKKCPACEKNIPAYKTVVGEVNLLCETHLDQLEGSLHNIIESHEPVARGADTSAKPNTESDKSIDTILDKIPLQFNKPPRKWGEFRSEIKSQLLAEILKGAEGFEIDKTTVTGYPESIWVEAIPTQYLTELFNEKEK